MGDSTGGDNGYVWYRRVGDKEEPITVSGNYVYDVAGTGGNDVYYRPTGGTGGDYYVNHDISSKIIIKAKKVSETKRKMTIPEIKRLEKLIKKHG